MNGVLQNKKILLAVTGSIAAYKSALLARMLQRHGAEVRIVMTPSAASFVTPLTFSTLTDHPVSVHMMEGDQWNNHVELGLWADLLLIAPLTANTMAKMASGLADNMVGAVYLSAKCPVFVAPAMDLDMWKHPSTQRNLTQLQSDGVTYIPVEHGLLASGLSGDGRMAEPQHIVDFLIRHFSEAQALIGKKILLTAGPTREPIDPVRFLSNHSTGTMGIALAHALLQKGAEVHLVLGPVCDRTAIAPQINTYPVSTAQEMFEQATSLFPAMDAAIMAAAVADYTPARYSDAKIKKAGDDLQLPLQRTKDIAAALGKAKKKGQYLVGFALETEEEEKNARTKLHKKNMDLIVLNSLREEGAGFGTSTNKVTLLYPDGKRRDLPLKSKREIAVDIVDALLALTDWGTAE